VSAGDTPQGFEQTRTLAPADRLLNLCEKSEGFRSAGRSYL
jgi:hypothetical protein